MKSLKNRINALLFKNVDVVYYKEFAITKKIDTKLEESTIYNLYVDGGRDYTVSKKLISIVCYDNQIISEDLIIRKIKKQIDFLDYLRSKNVG